MTRALRVKCVFLLMFVVLSLISFTCSAHEATGVNPKRTLAYIAVIEDYFEKTYGLVLHNEVSVHVAKSYRQYRKGMNDRDVENPKQFAKNTLGVTSRDHSILINDEDMTDEHFLFVLAHEMTHQFEFEYWGDDCFDDYVQLEGQADIIASRISGLPISVQDHGIPYKNLMSREQYFKSIKKHREETIEQIRFYAQQYQFI